MILFIERPERRGEYTSHSTSEKVLLVLHCLIMLANIVWAVVQFVRES